MSKFTFLTREQCFGDNQLDIFKKRGNAATLTDFSILLGCLFDIDKDKKTRNYWTKTLIGSSPITAQKNGVLNPTERAVGIRIALPLSSLNDIPVNEGSKIIRANDGILEVEYGYYPQLALPDDQGFLLAIASVNQILNVTGNYYTIDSRDPGDGSHKFLAAKYKEFELDGNRFIYATTKCDCRLSNGTNYKEGKGVWIKVLPVKWLIDEKESLMVMEKIISTGVQYHNNAINTPCFKETDIKKFIDEHLSRDILQNTKCLEQTKPLIDILKRRKTSYSYNFDFTESSEEDIIKGALKSNVAIFLHGKPGCGKSDRVKQLDPDFIELNLSHLDPELLDGLAGEKGGKEVHIKPPWLEELEEKCKDEPDKIHILFLEELTNASPVMQSKAYGIALDKKVAGRWKLPENARVVAAGNELEDSLVANEMAEPLYDRFAHVNIETTKENWLEWAVTPESYYSRLDYIKEETKRPKIHPAIYGYISLKGDEVLRTPYNKEHPQPHADPRRWKMASDMLYASNNPSTLKAIVGEDLTRDFIAFCQIPTISIEDVLKGNYTEDEIKEMDIGMKLATISGLVAVDTENMPKIREFAKKLGPEMCKKFEIQWTHGDEDRLEQLQELIMQENEEIDR